MLGPQDLWIALALGVFFFGAKKLPELSRSLGQAMSEFKKGVATGGDEPASPAAEGAKPEALKEGAKTDGGGSRCALDLTPASGKSRQSHRDRIARALTECSPA